MEELWYKNAVVYAVDIATFKDGNGDGIGDFQGLLKEFDYIVELGVTCLWLTPFFPSPLRDNGYDVSNYYGVDPRFGTLDDFLELVHKAGEHGVRIIIDLVINHTSNEHPWFQASRRDPGSRYRDYYVWADHPPPVPPDQGSMFPGQEATVWTYDEQAQSYFYHRFYSFQPELKIANPEVRDEILRIMDFWLSMGISGMRLDAASHMVEKKGLDSATPENPRGVLKNLRAHVEKRQPNAVLIGEADVTPNELVSYFGDNDQLTLVFNFLLNNQLFYALATQQAAPIAEVLHLMAAAPDEGQWGNFLRNFDEVDLERLTAEQRQQVFEAFAPEDDMQIYGRGARRRLAPMLGGERRLIELAFSLLFSLPGIPIFIYGDEIGMGEDLSLPGRKAVRTPMQWSDADNGGFSAAPADRLVKPLIAQGDFDYRQVNVARQRQQPDSLLNWIKRLVQLRRACPEIGHGGVRTLSTGKPQILSHCCEWKDGLVIAVHNLSDQPCNLDLELGDIRARPLEDLWGLDHPELIRDSTYRVDMEPYGYRWFRAVNTQ